LDSAHLGKHFNTGFVEYVMVGRENGAETCSRKVIMCAPDIVGALAFNETIVLQHI